MISGQSNDAYEAASVQHMKAGAAIKDRECPMCGMGMVYNTEDSKYHCMGVNDGCFHSEKK